MRDLKIGIVGIPGKWSTEALADAVAERTGYRLLIDMGRVVADLENGALIYDGLDLCQLDGLIIKKISETYSHHVLDRLEMLRFAELKGVKIFSRPEAVIRLLDRLACTVSLTSSGVPMPPTRVTEDPEEAFQAVSEFGEAVLKPLYSTKARGMILVDSDVVRAPARIAAFAAENPVMYIQKRLNLSGQDLGMFFVGGDYICTYARVSQNDSWNTTIHDGGKYEAFEPDPALIEMARKAQKPFGLSFTTVDAALTDDGPVIFEVSAFGGFRGARDGCGVDAAGMVAEHVISEIGK